MLYKPIAAGIVPVIQVLLLKELPLGTAISLYDGGRLRFPFPEATCSKKVMSMKI